MNFSIEENWLKFYNLLLDSNMDSFIASYLHLILY